MALMAGLETDLRVLLDPTKDGISQISEILRGYQGLSSIHIVTHGGSGELQIGSGFMSAEALPGYSAMLAEWKSHLTDDADILIYGCNVASGEKGQAFVSEISELTGADVAASINLTGSSSRGGDWILEHATGPIDQVTPLSASFLESYDGILDVMGGVTLNQDLASSLANTVTKVERLLAANLNVISGEKFTLTGKESNTEPARFDYIRFVPVTNQTSVTIEGESITNLSGYRLESVRAASGGSVLSLQGGAADETGSATFTFSGATGFYNVILGTFDENDGSSTFSLNRNDSGVVTISGTSIQGQSLTAMVADGDGLPETINYQWQLSSDGTTWSAISGATAPTLTLQQAQVGQRVRVIASYRDLLGASEAITSASRVVAALNAPGVVTISGTPTQGQTLTATVADADGLPATITYQWQQSSDGTTWSAIAGATGRTLTLQQAQVGRRLRAIASYVDQLGASEALTSAPTTAAVLNVNDPGVVSISGTPTQGQVLTATIADPDGLPATINYQWQQSSNGTTWSSIVGATARTLTLQQAQVGQRVRVIASYVDQLGASEALTSAPTTAAVLNVNDPGVVSISGTPTQGQVLTATVADPDGLPATITYQWQQSSDGTTWSAIAGATGLTLTLQQAQGGQQVRVSVTYTDALGTPESNRVSTPLLIASGVAPQTVYLSDLTPTASINGWGPYERDRSNGENAPNDGRTLTINGTTYAKGLGVHAASSLTYSLGGLYSRFQSFIGIDDEVASTNGSVIFRVLADGTEIFRSAILTGASGPQFVDLDVAGRQTLQLIVDTADGSAAWDKADWADAKLLSSGSPTTPTPAITLAVSPASVAEDGTPNLLYTFTRSGPTTNPLSVNYTVAGTATNGTDYTGIATAGTIKTVSFAAGSSTATVTVNPTADTTSEANETVALTLAAGTGYTIGTTTAVTGAITNDDQSSINFDRLPGTTLPTTGWTVNENTVGLAPFGIVGSELPVYTGPYEIPAGSVIVGMRFTSPVSLHQGNITIEKSLFQPITAGRGMPIVTTTNLDNWAPARGPVVIRDSEFDGSLLSAETGAWATGFWGIADMQRNYIHHFGGGIALYNTGRELDSLIEHNYVSDMLGWGNPATTGNHSDAFTIRDFSDAIRPDRRAIIRNNHFDNFSPNATAAAFIAAQSDRIDNVTMEGNLMEGPIWNLVLEANRFGYSNISAINNRFTPTGFGAAYSDGGPGWATWQDNYLFNPAMPNGMGNAI